MRIDYSPCASGKTYRMIQAAAKGGYIICHDEQACRYVAEQAKRMGITIQYPITFHEFIERRYHPRGVKRFFIDNLDICIQTISPVPIERVSLTKSVEECIEPVNLSLL